MGTTPKYGWPYPELSPDPPDGPAQIKALALAIENTLATKPLCMVRSGTLQSFASGATVALNFDINVINNANMRPAGQPSRIAASVAGWYQLSGCIGYTTNATGYRVASWAINGAYTNGTGAVGPATPGVAATAVAAPTFVQYLNIGDYVELRASHNAGVALSNFTDGPNSSWAAVSYLIP